jgi:hypothetical protein
MVTVNHDWDEENYVDTLNEAFDEYRKACYGGKPLPPTQVKEIHQAFLSGIHWLNTRESYDPEELEVALRDILGIKTRGGA